MQAKKTVVYYLCILLFLIIAFFSNDFNLVNVQKTAIITAIAIDKEGEDFSLTAVIATLGAVTAMPEISKGSLPRWKVSA